MVTKTKDIFRKYTDDETFAKIVDYNSVSEMWADAIKNYGDKPAIVDGEKTYTYAEVEALAAGLRTDLMVSLEARLNGFVGLLAENSIEFVAGFIAITTLGITAVIIPPQLPKEAVFGISRGYGLKALIASNAMSDKFELVKLRTPDTPIISAPSRMGIKTTMAKVDAKTPCVVVFTGGTTGKSKGALLSHEAVMQGTVNGCYGYKDVFFQRYLLVLPLSHVFGLIRNLMTSLYTGSTLFICKNNKDMFRDIAVFKPTILVVVPALANMALMLSKQFKKNMLGDSLKYIICGAAAVPPYLVTEYEKLGITLFPGYGLTESANLVSGNPECKAKPDSVGIPYPNQELKIENGELCLKGRNMMLSYVGTDEVSYDEDGWFKTGDLAWIDDEGFLYITGRSKEVIVLPSGENISPAELEAKFNEPAFIQDSQVFEDFDDMGGSFLALEVVLRMPELAGIENPGEYATNELQKINELLPAYKRVSRIVIRDKDFERTPSMKIVRYKKTYEPK